MANFMGPMAPPQAAPNAPPQLDIRTNPSQRAQFKEFMQGMNRPVMPPTTAPIAPMLPAPMPSPMDQIDIFAPAPMANGGVADPYAIEGKIGQSLRAVAVILGLRKIVMLLSIRLVGHLWRSSPLVKIYTM